MQQGRGVPIGHIEALEAAAAGVESRMQRRKWPRPHDVFVRDGVVYVTEADNGVSVRLPVGAIVGRYERGIAAEHVLDDLRAWVAGT